MIHESSEESYNECGRDITSQGRRRQLVAAGTYSI